jgi:CDP-4-dehydro-6-deoxyglucose reductase
LCASRAAWLELTVTMMWITLPSGHRFSSQAGQSLLDAAQLAGITLPHSCRTGRCSACKATVAAGETHALRDEPGLSPLERDAGWILSCVRAASTDVELIIEDLGDITVYPPRTWPARIQGLDRLASDVLRVVLRLPPAANFQYHPGQYIELIGPGGVRRSYSLAQGADPAGPLELHIRRVDAGVLSRYWFEQAQVNDLLRLNGPLGTFFLRDVHQHDLVFLATGTGIAPVKAMIEGLSRPGQPEMPRSISIYWGGRLPADLYWSPDGSAQGIVFTPVLSRADDSWSGERGHVQQVLMHHSVDRDWTRTRVYACGSDAMIQSAKLVLSQAGLDPRHFHADAFVSSAPA